MQLIGHSSLVEDLFYASLERHRKNGCVARTQLMETECGNNKISNNWACTGFYFVFLSCLQLIHLIKGYQIEKNKLKSGHP